LAFLAHEAHSLRRTSPDGHHEGLPRSKIIVENQGEMLSIEGMGKPLFLVEPRSTGRQE